MKKYSIRLKITLWFAGALILMIALTYVVLLSASRQVIQKTVRDGLIQTVEDNVDEIEYYDSLEELNLSDDMDQFMEWQEGYLEVDDDFLDQVNGIYTGLYDSDCRLIYGENPITAECNALPLENALIRTVKADGLLYYLFDRQLEADGLEGLWLRGVVSEEQTKAEMTMITRLSLILMPLLLLLAVAGGYMIAGRMLRPIQKISDMAAEIGNGDDLKKRIEIGQGADELHQLADGFNRMVARLEDAFEAEKQFTSDASHELRTPMAVIQAQCELALNGERELSAYEQALAVIDRQSRKMTKLIQDMLLYTRLEMQTERYPKERLSLTELTKGVCEDMAWIRQKGITLTWELQEAVYCEGNPELLTRLLVNLISNAYRYGKEDGHIQVRLEQGSDSIRLSVEDDGIGIALEEQQKIFERFYQADSSRTGEGTGLGLSMVRQIAKVHGGCVEVESVPQKGSCFTFLMFL